MADDGGIDFEVAASDGGGIDFVAPEPEGGGTEGEAPEPGGGGVDGEAPPAPRRLLGRGGPDVPPRTRTMLAGLLCGWLGGEATSDSRSRPSPAPSAGGREVILGDARPALGTLSGGRLDQTVGGNRSA